jgi:hypothetical protein
MFCRLHGVTSFRQIIVATAVALLVVVWAGSGRAQAPLPALGTDLGATSVSGLSAGAFMASQFHIANSSIVVGAGIVAGGPYGCAAAATPWFARPFGLGATIYWASGRCMAGSRLGFGIPATGRLEGQIHEMARAGSIDALEGVARARIYLFTSTADDRVISPVVDAAQALYVKLGVPEGRVQLARRNDAKHAFVTEEKGARCGTQDSTYITDCNYDQAGAILRHLYPDVARRSGRAPGGATKFDQRPYTRGSLAHGMADTGYLHVPEGCLDARACRVHVVFHGCNQTGEGFVRDAGYLEWADGNRIILLFPQVEKQPFHDPPGCWDWVGYTGPDYLTREGAQVSAVRRMLERLAEQTN